FSSEVSLPLYWSGDGKPLRPTQGLKNRSIFPEGALESFTFKNRNLASEVIQNVIMGDPQLLGPIPLGQDGEDAVGGVGDRLDALLRVAQAEDQFPVEFRLAHDIQGSQMKDSLRPVAEEESDLPGQHVIG